VEIPSDFEHPPIRATRASLESHFRSEAALALAPLRNPHHEPKVSSQSAARAVPAAVLIPIVARGEDLSLLITRRGPGISFAGHSAFPGGRSDPEDSSPEETALREAFEEIGLAPEQVQVIGRLGDYVSHSGFRIVPVVGITGEPLRLRLHPGEVEATFEVPLPLALDARSYRLRKRPGTSRAHFYLEYQGHYVAGPTASLLMNLIEELGKTHRE